MSFQSEDLKNDDEIDQNQSFQPVGVIPLYTYLPPLKSLTQQPNNQRQWPLADVSSFPFLPSIHKTNYNGPKISNIEINALYQDILEEFVTEETLDLLEEALKLDMDMSPLAIQRRALEKEAELNRFTSQVATEVLDDVIREICYEIAVNFFDDIISNHRVEIEARVFTQDLVPELAAELMKEVACEVMHACKCGEECINIVHEVLIDEVKNVVEDVLTDYSAQCAFSQYKQITKFAGDLLLDSLCLQALLPEEKSDTHLAAQVIDHFMLSILLDKLLNLKSMSAEKCIPLQWYRKKFVLNVAFDSAMDQLTKLLDKELGL
ncbi:unnamed protein product [Clavelina lepadiformis]|uniref:Uncharacterized protein n=1 Tax=Clavelina lepadiformis TaxID=159417 RepID=A0ABP0H1V0_CLALP